MSRDSVSIDPRGSILRSVGRGACMALLSISAIVSVEGAAHAGGLYLNEFATPSMGTAGAGAEAWANSASTAGAFHNDAAGRSSTLCRGRHR
jgi:hypothetical protein